MADAPKIPVTPGPLILVIEDEPQLRKFLIPALEGHGYRVLDAENGESGLLAARQNVPDVILLDLGLPDMDGLEVTRRLRQWSKIPVIVLSARGQETDKVSALDAGADDYLTKPFGVPELLARIRVALRHQNRTASAGGEFITGPLRVDLDARQVFLNGNEIQLTAIEYKLLVTLIQSAGKVVTHRQLLNAVWGPGHSDQVQYLRVYVAHLRRKLEPDPAKTAIFRTETGVGYRLLVPE